MELLEVPSVNSYDLSIQPSSRFSNGAQEFYFQLPISHESDPSHYTASKFKEVAGQWSITFSDQVANEVEAAFHRPGVTLVSIRTSPNYNPGDQTTFEVSRISADVQLQGSVVQFHVIKPLQDATQPWQCSFTKEKAQSIQVTPEKLGEAIKTATGIVLPKKSLEAGVKALKSSWNQTGDFSAEKESTDKPTSSLNNPDQKKEIQTTKKIASTGKKANGNPNKEGESEFHVYDQI
jgi:hypothetical protein